MSAPRSMVSATRARGDVYLCMPGNRGECSGYLGGWVKCSNGRLVNRSTGIASRGGNRAERFHNFRVSARVLHKSIFNIRDMCIFK